MINFYMRLKGPVVDPRTFESVYYGPTLEIHNYIKFETVSSIERHDVDYGCVTHRYAMNDEEFAILKMKFPELMANIQII